MDLLLDPGARVRWQPEITSMRGPQRLGEGDEQQGTARMLGFEVTGTSKALELAPGRFSEEVFVGVRLRVSYGVTPVETGVRITHRVDADLPRGPLGRLLSLFLRRRLRRMQRKALENLVAQSEATRSA